MKIYIQSETNDYLWNEYLGGLEESELPEGTVYRLYDGEYFSETKVAGPNPNPPLHI